MLLNSDVEVAGDWLHRLQRVAYLDDATGSVTPFSNNATIFSFPDCCKDNPRPFGLETAELDRVFAALFTEVDRFEVPTGVGAFMYLRRACLQQVGVFDEATFGRGYGEENDWCQRALALGWRHYHAACCFIFHAGGVSFADEQSPRIARALELLDQRYPRYHSDIQAFIAGDPAKAARTRALLQLFARQHRPKIALISHHLGGGAQQHVAELAMLYREQALFLVIVPHEAGRSVTLTLYDGGRALQDGLYFDVDRDYARLVELLRGLGIGRLHFHHTMGLHPRLWRLADDLGCGYDLTIHDYYLINGNPTLTDGTARHVPVERDDFDQRCAEHYPLPPGLHPQAWRDNQRLLVEGADRVIFPSLDCRDRFCRFFQVQRPVAAWHPDFQQSQPYPQPAWSGRESRPLRVLVIGAISREKGAELLESVALALGDEAVEFHLLGYAYRALDAAVITHGPYDNARAWELVEDLRPDLVWYPALWPETYSYTLSIALHLGLPVVVPDIGAFVERVAGRPLSVVRPWQDDLDAWCSFWREVIRDGLPAQSAPRPAPERARIDFYAGDYLAETAAAAGSLGADTLAALEPNFHAGLPQLTGRERLLGQLWALSRRPAVAKALSLVPFRLQRALKRRLSPRPMHDIVRGE
jgi:glycosyltransferase involved in cell wall biosynthesis